MKKLLISIFCAFIAQTLNAQAIDNILDFNIRTGWRQADGTHIAGLDIQLAQGWKTYWRHPGDAGLPPSFDWSESSNLLNAQILWPSPTIHWSEGIRSIGYSESVILPLSITPKGKGPITLSGVLQIGICKDVCIPVQMKVTATLSEHGTTDHALSQAIARQTKTGSGYVTCTFQPTQDSMAITLHVPKTGSTTIPEMALETAETDMWVAQPKVTDGGNTWIASSEILAPSGKPTSVARSGIRLTVFETKNAYEYKGCRAN